MPEGPFSQIGAHLYAKKFVLRLPYHLYRGHLRHDQLAVA